LEGVRGWKESEVHRIIHEVIKARVEAYRGDFTMTGPNCLKVLERVDLLVELLEDHEIKEKFKTFFSQFLLLISLLFSTSPLRCIDWEEEEWVYLNGPFDNNSTTSPLTSDLHFLRELCIQHGNLLPELTERKPTPKHHILVHHTPIFASEWLSVGQFSEQNLERCHAALNKLKRRFAGLKEDHGFETRFRQANVSLSANKKRKVGEEGMIRGRALYNSE
jgi:hypothetical protein